MILRTFTIALLVLQTPYFLFSQVNGPKSPTAQSSVGTGNPWTGATGTFASDNIRSVVSSAGDSEQLISKGFGFNLLNTDVVAGIELEVERSSDLGDPISIISPWKSGQLSKVTNFPITAGDNRSLIVFIGTENGNDVLIDNVSIGGVQLTRLLESSYHTTFWAHTECWYAKESDLAALNLGNYDIDVNYEAHVKDQFFDILSAGLFDNVDQGNPFFSDIENTVNGAAVDSDFGGQNIVSGAGGMFLTNIFCGNNTSPKSVNGATNTFLINSGFTEGVDIYIANTAVAPTSGGCMQTAYKLSPAGGTESPTFTFKGAANRRLAIGIGLRKVSTKDVKINLQKNGVDVGNNLASTNVFWPNTDAYVTYGGPTNTWGATWLYSDINNPLFASSLGVHVYNGSARVDHVRTIVYTTSVLPVELIDFYAHRLKDMSVETGWVTATEFETDYFEVERSENGIDFISLSKIKAAGNSNSLLTYNYTDRDPLNITAYYRLKMIDINGTVKYSEIKTVKSNLNSAEIIPNPVKNWAKIAVNSNKVSISIVTTDGKVIDHDNGYYFNDAYYFNISNYPNGVYYLIQNDNGNVVTKTFVKQSN